MIGRIAGADSRSGKYGSKFVAPNPDVVEPGPDPVPGFPLFPADAPPGSIIGSSGADRLRGNADDNVMFGLGGDNTINRLAGADTIYCIGGNDTCSVDDGGDIVIEAAGGGRDVVDASVSHALGDHVEHLVITGSAPLTGIGNSLANRLTGNAYDTILRGAGGTDTIVGEAGHDSLYGGAGTDVLSGGAGANVSMFRPSSDRHVILDFHDNIDAIRLVDLGISSFDPARAHATQSGAHVVFDFGDGDSLTLRNTTITMLGDDLIFV